MLCHHQQLAYIKNICWAINKVILCTDLCCLLHNESLGTLLMKKTPEQQQWDPTPYETRCSILGHQPADW